MKGFVLGVLVSALAFGGYEYWRSRSTPPEPVVAGPEAPAETGSAKKRRGPRPRTAARAPRPAVGSPGEAGIDEPEPPKLSAADLRPVAQGDDLSRPDVVRLDMASAEGGRELGQDEIDARFRAQEEAILTCIAEARPDPESFIPGRVTVKFRIQRTGHVRGVRVEAPAVLQRGGIYGCIKGVVTRLSFPASNGSQVVTYPYALN